MLLHSLWNCTQMYFYYVNVPCNGIFSQFCLKSMGIIFRGRQGLRNIMSVLFHENHRVGGTTLLSLNSAERIFLAKVSETQRNK